MSKGQQEGGTQARQRSWDDEWQGYIWLCSCTSSVLVSVVCSLREGMGGMKDDLRCMWSGTKRHRLDVLGLQVDPSRSLIRSASGSSEEMWWKQQPVDCTYAHRDTQQSHVRDGGHRILRVTVYASVLQAMPMVASPLSPDSPAGCRNPMWPLPRPSACTSRGSRPHPRKRRRSPPTPRACAAPRRASPRGA